MALHLPPQESRRTNEGKDTRPFCEDRKVNPVKALAVILVVTFVLYGILFFNMEAVPTHVVPSAITVQNVIRSRSGSSATSSEHVPSVVADKNITRGGSSSVHSYNMSVDATSTTSLSVKAPPLLLRLQTYSSRGANQYAHFPIGHNGVPTRLLKCMNETVIIENILSNDMHRLTSKPQIDAVLFNFVEEGFLNGQVAQLSRISAQIEASGQTQVWIFKGLESGSYTRWIQGQVKNLPVHATKTYHKLSEMVSSYGHYAEGRPMPGYEDPNAAAKSLAKLMTKKTKLAVWVARNCLNTFWPRLEFVKSLKNMMDVDMYGACGTLKCQPRMSQACLDLFEKYKFFLSLENSECDNYVTEKLWNALIHGIVPVVYGPRRESYERLAPPNSFIHVADFNSSKALVDYLLFLDQNPKEYLKYFEWRTQGTVARGPLVTGNHLLCALPELIRKVKEGRIKKHLLSETPYYKSCRPQKGTDGFHTNRVKLADWTPKK